jgi:hypothetical protein
VQVVEQAKQGLDGKNIALFQLRVDLDETFDGAIVFSTTAAWK